MRRGIGLPAMLAGLIVTAAQAQGTDGGTSTPAPVASLTDSKPATTDHGCVFVGPSFGADVLQVGWNTSPGVVGALPGVRAGYWLGSGFVAGEAGVKLGLSPASGYTTLTAKLGGLYGHDLWSSGSLRAYGLAGLDANLYAYSSSGSGSSTPLFGLTLGAGLQWPLGGGWTLGGEAGLHTLLEPAPQGVDLATNLFVSVVGSWSFPGTCTRDTGGSLSHDTTTSATPTVTIALTPPPEVITHHDSTATPCQAYVTDGWMEPSQAVWQDDLSFDDKPGKQLTRAGGDAVAYHAELPMVVEKDTLLFGVHHYLRGGAPTIVDSRDYIVLSGLTNCTTPKPVKMRFTLTNAGAPETLWTSPELAQVKLSGAAQKEYEPWSVRLPAREGIPADYTFKITRPGGYTVRAELLADGNPTGLLMTVGGDAKVMTAPAVHFVPVMLSKLSEVDEGGLRLLTNVMADQSAKNIPDHFPLRAGGLPTTTRVIRNLSDAKVPDRWFEARRVSYLVAALNDTLASSTFLDGAGRVVAVMKSADFKAVFGEGAAGMTVSESVTVHEKKGDGGRTLSWKVMLVPSYEGWDTVAHELLHTLPEGWADSEMKAECGKSYHNEKETLAHGERITFEGVASKRERKVALISLMGPSVDVKTVYQDQCTYWHLTKMFAGGPPDPPVMLVRAMVGAPKKGKLIGELRPVYELMGNSDLTNTLKGGGPYAFVFKSAQGTVLGRFPFNPLGAEVESKAKLEVMSFVGRVPVVPGWATLELQGPGGAVLDKKVRSDAPPQISIDEPKDMAKLAAGAKTAKVRWTSKAASLSLPLLSSVLYSADRGTTWTDQAFEQGLSEFEVKLNPNQTEHLVKVVTTDGTRSAEAIIRLLTPAPAQQQQPAPKK